MDSRIHLHLQTNWHDFYDAVEHGSPHKTLLRALTLFDEDSVCERFAVDLGYGSGRDTLVTPDWPDPFHPLHNIIPRLTNPAKQAGQAGKFVKNRSNQMKSEKPNLKRMDNIGIAVESLDESIAFFTELGLNLEGRAMVEGEWAGRVTGLGNQRVEIAMMRTPDGHSRLELSRFLTPPVIADHRNAPVNALGYLRAMFTVEDIDDTLERLGKHGARLVGEVVQYQDSYRLCYIRGPEGILIGLAQELERQTL